MRPADRDNLRVRYKYRCGYCGVRERDVGAELTVDHFQPQSKGGLNESENWGYCCHACNEFKSDFWQLESIHRIIHPLRDNMGSHLVQEADGTLRPLTETGAFHIERLHLNRTQLVQYRRARKALRDETKRKAIHVNRIETLEEMVEALRERLSDVDHD